MNTDEELLPEATPLDAEDGRTFKLSIIRQGLDPGTEKVQVGDRILVDRRFRYGLRLSNYALATADELERMDLEAFRRSWDGVACSSPEGITEEIKQAYIDNRFYWIGPFSEQLAKALKREQGEGIWSHPTYGSRSWFDLLRRCRRGLAASMISSELPPMPEFLPAQREAYSPRGGRVHLNNAGRAILKLSKRLSEEGGEQFITNEHLLLALLEYEDSDFNRFIRSSLVATAKMVAQLRRFLGLGENRSVSPRVRAYQLCASIECDLKDAVLNTLRDAFGEEKWWVDGVPANIRKACASTREDEDCILPSEAYLYLVQYKEIIRANWDLFGSAIEKASACQGKDAATSWMNSMNPVRNAVMHPSKREIASEDLDQLSDCRRITSHFVAILGDVSH